MLQGDFDRAELCFQKSNDLMSLFLIYSSLGYQEGIEQLGKDCFDKKMFALAFNCFFMLRNVPQCLECLVGSGRYPEAAIFSKTYCPSQISRVVALWKQNLKKTNPVIAQSIADPLEYDDDEGFNDLFMTKEMEAVLGEKMMVSVPADRFQDFGELLALDLLRVAKQRGVESL